MNMIIKSLLMLSLFALVLPSCSKEDEMDELHISFKTGGNYVSADATLPALSTGLIGIEAETEKAQDPIISFNISVSINGGADVSVYNDNSLSLTNFEYDFTYLIGDVSGDTYTYTFTITNKDGLTEQESITFTVQ